MFPTGSFDQRANAEDLFGRYTVKTTFYDADYKIVTKAEKPGRYGAVVEVTPEGERAVPDLPNACSVCPTPTR